MQYIQYFPSSIYVSFTLRIILPSFSSNIILLHFHYPSPTKQRNAVLNGVDDIADNGEHDEEDDDDYRDDEVALDHCRGDFVRWDRGSGGGE